MKKIKHKPVSSKTEKKQVKNITRKAGSRHGKTKGENIRSRSEMQFFRRGKQGYKGSARREKQIRGCTLCARLLHGVPYCLG